MKMTRAMRWIYAADPALMLTSTFIRVTACMICVFGIPYIVGPLMGMRAALAVGAGGGMMGVIPQLLPAQGRRNALFRCGAAYVGVMVGATVMTALTGLPLLQMVAFIVFLCLPVLAAKIHRTLGGALVQGMIGSGITILLTGRLVKDPWQLWMHDMVLYFLIMVGVACCVVTLVRRPPEVLRQARKSLQRAHRQTTERLARALREGTPRSLTRVNRSVEATHRCAIAVEAAMDQTHGFPVEVGEQLQHSAYDIDMTLGRLATVTEHIVTRRDPALDPVARRIAEVCDLLTERDADSLALATELVGGVRDAIGDLKADPESVAGVVTAPELLRNLISEIIDGGIAGAAADQWSSEHPGVAWRAGWDSWVPRSAGLFDLADAEREATGEFRTGLAYADLSHVGEAQPAAKAAGTVAIGRLVLGLAERQALQTFVAVAVASVLGYLISGPHFFWASFGAFVVLIGTTTTSSRLRKTLRRVIGSVVGAAGGLAWAWLVGHAHPVVSLISIIVLASVAFTLLKRRYRLFTALLTATMMQIYVITAAPLVTYALERVAENIIGAVTAGVVASLILPLHTSTVVRTVLAEVATALEQLLDAVDGVLDGRWDARPRIAASHVEGAAANAQRLAASMLGPFAGTSGSWVRGVASRLPAVTSAAKDLANYAGEVRDGWEGQTGHADVDAEDFHALIDHVRHEVSKLANERAGQEVGTADHIDRRFSMLTRSLSQVLTWREDMGDPDAASLRRIVYALNGLNAASHSLMRAAWGGRG